MTNRSAYLGAATMFTFIVAGALRSWFDVNPYVVSLVMLLGVILGGWTAYAFIRERR